MLCRQVVTSECFLAREPCGVTVSVAQRHIQPPTRAERVALEGKGEA